MVFFSEMQAIFIHVYRLRGANITFFSRHLSKHVKQSDRKCQYDNCSNNKRYDQAGYNHTQTILKVFPLKNNVSFPLSLSIEAQL